jgi:hypothetical protein
MLAGEMDREVDATRVDIAAMDANEDEAFKLVSYGPSSENTLSSIADSSSRDLPTSCNAGIGVTSAVEEYCPLRRCSWLE